ncbi:hypothetical protein D3C86_1753560 [compost metagenome]
MDLKKTQLIIAIVAALAVPGGTFAFSYGSLDARIRAVEQRSEQTVTRGEYQALSARLDEVVVELRGLRSDLIVVIKERSRP